MNGEQFDYTKIGSGTPAQGGSRPAAPPPPGRFAGSGLPPRQRKKPVALIGCAATLIFFIGVLGFIGGIGFLVINSMKSSDIYRTALELVRSHPETQQKMGEPIEAGWYVMGSISKNGSDETVNLTVPLSGPYASGTLYVRGDKKAGMVGFRDLALVLDGSEERIEIPRE